MKQELVEKYNKAKALNMRNIWNWTDFLSLRKKQHEWDGNVEGGKAVSDFMRKLSIR